MSSSTKYCPFDPVGCNCNENCALYSTARSRCTIRDFAEAMHNVCHDIRAVRDELAGINGSMEDVRAELATLAEKVGKYDL